jgi:hypothetical protein
VVQRAFAPAAIDAALAAGARVPLRSG